MLITEDRLQQALTYLAQTDEAHAQAKALMKGLEKQEKTIKGQAFLDTENTATVASRDAMAHTSKDYRDWIGKYEDAVMDYEVLNNKRLREQLVIEVWRSLNSSRNKGNIT